MFDQISRLLMTISNYMDFTERLTINLINQASNESINDLLNGIDNRERLIKIITKFNLTLENSLSKIPAQELKVLEVSLLKYWVKDLDAWKHRMGLLDEQLTLTVQELRDQTRGEIRSTFDTRKKMDGYNLRSTK